MAGFSISKLFSGFNLTKGANIGKIIFIATIVMILIAVYHQITKPTQTNEAEEMTIVNNLGSKKVFTEIYTGISTRGEIECGFRLGYRF